MLWSRVGGGHARNEGSGRGRKRRWPREMLMRHWVQDLALLWGRSDPKGQRRLVPSEMGECLGH